MRKTLSVLAISLVASVVGAVAPSSSALAEGAVPTDSGYTIVSAEEAAAAGLDVSAVLVAAEPAVDAEIGIENATFNLIGSPPPPDPPATNWDTVITSTTTWDGLYAPTRWGSGKLGFSKACNQHNVCNSRIFNAAYQGYCKEPSGTRCVYIAYVLYNGQPKIAIRVIMERARTSTFGTTSDNRAVGTLTAYCVGSTRCPSYVNSA